jgi:hypothetical protein
VSLFKTPKKSATISSIFLSSQLDPKASREKGNFVGSHTLLLLLLQGQIVKCTAVFCQIFS